MVPVTVTVSVPVEAPLSSTASADKACSPASADQLNPKGAAASLLASTPSTKNSTRVTTPSESEAATLTFTVEPTEVVRPVAGDMNTIDGGTLGGTKASTWRANG